MARIPDELISRLKRDVAVDRVIAASGVELSRRGQEHVGLCPFHPDEKTPSLSVNAEKGVWQCFGCGKKGSVIDFVMALDGVGFRAAVEQLIAEHLPDVSLEPPSPAAPVGPCPVTLEGEVWERLAEASSFYEATLLGEDARGREYLESRGLWEEDLARRFRLGFANRTLGPLLPLKTTLDGRRLREALRGVGILRESGHEHLNGRVTVLLSDLEERPAQMYGRTVTPNLRSGTPKHMYLAGSRSSCVFNLAAIRTDRELIVCEAIFDALTFLTHGFANVTCSFGANGFTPALLEAMRRHDTKRVLIAYDRDEASEKAAVKLAERLLTEGIEPYRVLFPKGMDANEYALKVTPAAKSLELAVRKASWMGTGRPPSVLIPELPAPAAGSTATGEAAEEKAASSSAASAPASPPPASPVPPAPRLEVPTEVREHEVVIRLGDRRYRARGLAKNLSPDALKVNLLANRGDGFFVDTLDLYAAKPRERFAKQAAVELAIEEALAKRDLGKVLLKLEELQDEQIREALAPKTPTVTLADPEKEAALAHWRRPDLIEATREHLSTGLVGEATNKLVVYLAAVSRKLSRPLAVLVQSSSAAGKSALIDSVLALMPEEERVAYSAMTGQSLFYMGETDLKHKILAIAEEEGAERARYALKLLQSEGKLSIASTGKDPATGRLLTHEYHVEGPVAILTTTTAIDLDEEFENRCLVLNVDESREQTEAIHRFQRRAQTLEGLRAREEGKRIVALHKNSQRLLRPLHVVNRYAESLRYPSTSTRTRRDQTKYLGLIEAIALLFQHQREVKQLELGGRSAPYVEVLPSDIELANRLAREVLGRCLSELPGQTHRLLELIRKMVGKACRTLAMEQRDYRFSRRDLRGFTGWGDTQLKVHLSRLVDLEYLVVCSAGGHRQRHLYELAWEGEGLDGGSFVLGLLDVDKLEYDANRSGSDANRSGGNGNRSGSGRPPVGGWSGGGRSEVTPFERETSPRNPGSEAETALLGEKNELPSYSQARRTESPAGAQKASGEG